VSVLSLGPSARILLNQRQRRLWGHHLELCESEIEQAFLAAYLRLLDSRMHDTDDPDGRHDYAVTTSIDGAQAVERGAIDVDMPVCRLDLIIVQPQVNQYRPDFVVWRTIADPTGGEPIRSGQAAVECDGHDFHERTREQAEHDKKRDRLLQKWGLNVLRFTGSRLWNNAAGCAKEVDEFLSETAYRTAGKRHKFPV
jgi:hypothetical protein